jgi:cytidine deaminase
VTDLELLNLAVNAMENAYSPYSEFKVGAALLCENGDVYCGANIENSSYSATICAERVALFKAVSDRQTSFKSMAVVGCYPVKTQDFCYPCGVCLQTLREFCAPDFKIITANSLGDIKEFTLKELLPYGFSLGR